MQTRKRTLHTTLALLAALLAGACAESSDESELFDSGLAPGLVPDAQNGSTADAASGSDGATSSSRDAAASRDATAAELDGSSPASADAGVDTRPRFDARRPAPDADGPSQDSGATQDSATSDAASASADAGPASSDAAVSTGPVMLAWAEPSANSTLKGSVTLRFSGRAFQNVEVFRGATMLVRATVSADRTSASATLDTTKLPNGTLSLSAHAWNSPPDTAFTSEADAGARSFTVDNGGGGASNQPLVGVYCGNSVDGIRQFETWLGRPVDGILGYTGNADWADYDGSVGWASGVWSAIDRRVFWSVPLIVNGASLSQAGSGAYDDHYRKAAQTLASWRPQEPKLYIRTGWEFNGNWFPWNAQGKAGDFKAAFRRFVSVFRSVSDRFVFEWNVNIGDVGMDPETAYPGDDVVDIVGMDFYWQTFLPTNPQQAWSQIVNQKWGLKWHQDFAKAHGKPTAYSEWGVRYDNAGYYIEQVKQWFDQHPVLYHNYWNGNNDYPGKLSDGQYPATGAAYKSAFGP